MNGLKKLFSPSTLAATLATGLLLSSALVALATTCVSATGYAGIPSGCPESYCQGKDSLMTTYYWCCSSPYPNCASCTVTHNQNQSAAYGFCTDGYPYTCCH